MSSLRARSLKEILTFTRASTATYFDVDGALTTAEVDEPRIEYDPATGAVRGLLIEEARTNYLQYSQDMGNAVWSKLLSSIAADAAVAPDGTTTADKLVEDSSASELHYAAQTYAKDSSSEVQVYTASGWAKSAGRTHLLLAGEGSSGAANGANVVFNLTAGTAATPSIAGAWDNAQASIQECANGWYRCSLCFRVNNDSQAGISILAMLHNGTSNTYTGDGSSGLYLWGWQMEKGAYATSYIMTAGGAEARSRDVCDISNLAWFNEDAGTIFAEYLLPWTYIATDTAARRIVQVDDGADDGHYAAYLSSGSRLGETVDGSTSQAIFNVGAFAAVVVQKQAYAWSENDIASVASGAALQSDASATLPTALVALRVGGSGGAGLEANGHIRKVKFYPRRLSDNELRALVA